MILQVQKYLVEPTLLPPVLTVPLIIQMRKKGIVKETVLGWIISASKLIPLTVSNIRLFTIMILITLPNQIVLRLIQPTRVVKVTIVLMIL